MAVQQGIWGDKPWVLARRLGPGLTFDIFDMHEIF